ncbi:14691_t:CDS:1 [Cetraspora pellucida]|uniref:14691_t:CDS:1 n=1 Tax=Cetraspora pellucida TaxID=1433469 RepID=A0ACA9L5H7_9GLOM|nr:14691_t:CDS:1 [Cetraspora pellucida]
MSDIDINIQDIDGDVQNIDEDIQNIDINVQDIFNGLVRSSSTYTESNLDTLSTCSLQVDSSGLIRHAKRKRKSQMDKFFNRSKISQDCKYCTIKYAPSTSTGTLKEHIKKNHSDIYNQNAKTELVPYNREEQLEHNKYLITWIITSLQPFSVTEEKSFVEMLNKFNSRYKVPTRYYISLCIMRTFQNQQKHLSEDLQNISGMIALTTDMWTSGNNYSFLGVTIHWIDNN